jgi:hypothetical protein
MKPFVLLTPGLLCNSVKTQELLQPCKKLLMKTLEENEGALCKETEKGMKTLVEELEFSDCRSAAEKDELLDTVFFVFDNFVPENHYFGPNADNTAIGVWPENEE